MKIEINLPEVFSAATFGAVSGVLSFASHQRWIRLGRDAYISHCAQIFDTQTIHPPHLVVVIIVGVVFALFAVALFKGLAFLFGLLSSAFQNKSRVEQA
jgi:H+/Cl- antiporter ClcA